MNMKSLLFIGTLTLAGIASAKSYDIVLSAPAKAGSVQLAAGEYSLKVEGNNAIFTNVETGKKVTATVKLQNGNRRFEQTAVDSDSQNGTDVIKDIELGGSNTMLELGE